jgi:hypothetical protein
VTTYASRIAATVERRKALGSHGDLGPGALAVGEWRALGLELPDLDAMRLAARADASRARRA